ncbi:MAG: N-acetyltransferase family protein [Chloroflexota bacterium]
MNKTDYMIRPMVSDDWAQVAKIYADGIAGRMATFETNVPEWDYWDEKHLDVGRLVLENSDGVILGWVALSAVSHRDVYRGVVENTIYVASDAHGQGVGSRLMGALVEASEANGIWMIQAVTFQENSASIALHKKFGFREVGYRERIAKLDGVWRSTVMLERRSAVAGI